MKWQRARLRRGKGDTFLAWVRVGRPQKDVRGGINVETGEPNLSNDAYYQTNLQHFGYLSHDPVIWARHDLVELLPEFADDVKMEEWQP